MTAETTASSAVWSEFPVGTFTPRVTTPHGANWKLPRTRVSTKPLKVAVSPSCSTEPRAHAV